MMEIDINSARKTKLCPFCAEVIMAQALKCRYCGEILSPDRIKAIEKTVTRDTQDTAEGDNKILFAGKPSLWAMTGSFFKAAIILALAFSLIKYPVEKLFLSKPAQKETSAVYEALVGNEDTSSPASGGLLGIKINENQAKTIAKYRVAFGTGLFILIPLLLAIKAWKLKTIFYEVTESRIEYSRGILDRKVDNLDTFRIIDLKMRRSLLDCVTGVGTVTVLTTDKTDPEFTFEKVRNCRKLYDAIKKASLVADRKTNVVHIE
jgi:membrane protein YdbS with pleckstrin-like domain